MGFFKKIKSKFIKPKDEVLETIKTSKNKTVDEKYSKGLDLAKNNLTKKIKLFFAKKRIVDEEFFNELEEMFIMSDLGFEFAKTLITKIKNETKLKKIENSAEIIELILEILYETYVGDSKPGFNKLKLEPNKLNVILIIGVNGVGKTTSIGKISHYLVNQNYKVCLAAADTFRAGAVAQLKEWGTRTNLEVIGPEKQGQDPASVVYKAIEFSKTNNYDVLIIDTAGRLHNKQNLMAELEKIKKIIQKGLGYDLIETLLVLDATTGQNGILQAKGFNEIIKLTGIILTKMDSSSKGGIIFPIKEIFDIPVKFIGLGETLNDFQEFDIDNYLYNLVKDVENINYNEKFK